MTFAALPMAALRRSHVEQWVKAMQTAPPGAGRARDAAACGSVKLHDLRHFYASGLIAEGCDVVTVQRALGHRSASVTLATYAHLWPTAEDRTRKAAAAMLAATLRTADSERTSREA